jgi:hypothetical protein
MSRRRAGEPRGAAATLDTVLFGFAGGAAIWLAYLLLAESLQAGWQVVLLVVFWLLVAYLVLPRLHLMLTSVYVPRYFIGRTRTSDGLLGDPVNLALLGDETQLHAAMERAGWTRADDISLSSTVRIVTSTLSRRSYAEAPVSPLHLFDRQQDCAYQQEVAGNPSRRHHVRFWRCPPGWLLPGGYAVDWLAAGTYDRAVGLSLFTLQVTHRVASDIDTERDHIVTSLTAADPSIAVQVISDFSTGYHDRNGGGDSFRTDGDLPVVDLRATVPPVVDTVEEPARRRERPPPIVFGSAVAFTRGVFALVTAVIFGLDPASIDVLPAGAGPSSEAVAVVAFVLIALIDIGLGSATFAGFNWARVLLMLGCVVTILGGFLAELQGGPRPTLGSGLPVIALGILELLALTSHRARDFTRGRLDASADGGRGTARPHPPSLSREGRYQP